MFSFKVIVPNANTDDWEAERLERNERRRKQMIGDVRRAIREGLVFRAHERSARKLSVASNRADETIGKMDDKIDECRFTQSQFFDARRNITKAACEVAMNHKIDMELVDIDSDDEREGYYEGRNTESTKTRSCSASAG